MAGDKNHEQWGTRLGVILAVAGSAVGLGNFLRFPGQAAANGGGAFMIPYFCALLCLGIPIGWAEWTMGKYGGRKGLHSAPAIMGLFTRGSGGRYLGVVGVLIPLAVSFYYTFIESWCLLYMWKFLTGGIGIDVAAPVADQIATSKNFFLQSSGDAGNGVLFDLSHAPTLIFFLITFAINIFLIFRGLSKGIEKFCSYAMPLMAICALVVLVRVLTLGTPDPAAPELNVINGLGHMWNPNFDALTNPQTWLAAAGQIFFSLSVGFGVIINYASYMKPKDDTVLSGLTASATNELFEVGFGGLITLTAAFVFLGATMTAEAAATGTFGLGFTTLPVVFAKMGGAGNLVGAIWFFMLFLAAITSSLSMYQPTVAFLTEALPWSRKKAIGVLVGLCAIGSGMTLYFSGGGSFRSTVDDWVGTLLIFVMAAIQIIAFGWIFGIERGWKEAHEGAEIRIPKIFKFIMKYVAPAYLLIVFAAFCYKNLGSWLRAVAANTEAQLAMALIIGVSVFLCWAVWVGEKRWRAAGLDINDDKPL